MERTKVALVTGASRGAGRGIASVLGETGAIVYVTGRTRRGCTASDGIGGSIDETAEEVTRRGGLGIAHPCDHTSEEAIEGLFARIREEQGHLDLLVNNVWGGYEGHRTGLSMSPFWMQPRNQWERMFVSGVKAHLLTAQVGVPLMLPRKQGLILSTIAWAFDAYLMNLYYDLSKSTIIRMIMNMALELKPHGIAAIALAPGFMRTERVMAAHALQAFDLAQTESPEYIGRAVAALTKDREIMRRTGMVCTVGELAVEYGFTDIDGRQPPPFRLPEPNSM